MSLTPSIDNFSIIFKYIFIKIHWYIVFNDYYIDLFFRGAILRG
jgi:hypothetical protein